MRLANRFALLLLPVSVFLAGMFLVDAESDRALNEDGRRAVTPGWERAVTPGEERVWSAGDRPAWQLSHPTPHPAAERAFRVVTDTTRAELLMAQQDLDDIIYVSLVTEREPAMGSFDLMDYSPSRLEHGARPWGQVESWIRWAADDAFVSLSWHWNAPMFLHNDEGREWWRGFYADASTYDVRAAVEEPESAERAAMLRDVDAVAVQLRKFRDAGVPVFWRPLHEAWGGWFWWGKAGPATYRALWRLVYERLTIYHGLDHLIWVYTHRDAAWYPGDDVVDVIGVDLYGSDARTDQAWADLQRSFGHAKPFAVTETDRLPDALAMRARGERWAWYSMWADDHIRDIRVAALRSAYTHPDVMTRSAVGDWRTDESPWLASEVAMAAPLDVIPLESEGKLVLLLPDEARGFIRILGAGSETVRRGRVAGAEVWDISDLPAGNYVVRWFVRTGRGSSGSGPGGSGPGGGGPSSRSGAGGSSQGFTRFTVGHR